MSLWFVGGYGADMDGSARGISLAESLPDGTLEDLGAAVEVESPSYLLAGNDHVYAVGEGSGRVHSFHREGGTLVEDGSASSGGSLPCHLGLLDSALVVANYDDGALGFVSLRPDGSIDELVQSLPGSGSGPREEQQGPHSHASIQVDASTLVSLDLGSDELHTHAVDGSQLVRTGSFSLPAGSGPRDVARHESGLVYVLGELSNVVFVLEWTGEGLELVTSTPVPGAAEGDHGSGLSFGPGGFVYTGVRGSGLIGVLKASEDGRTLEAVGSVSSEGEWPRHHAIDGDILHVANQFSDSVATFRLGADGMPQLIGHTELPSPSFLLRIG